MPSLALQRWRRQRIRALDKISHAHQAVGGTARGRRVATQQINHAFAVLLASQFQGFCRDLHSESVDYLLSFLQPSAFVPLLRAEWARGRYLDRGNAQPASLGADFGRLGMDFWMEVEKENVKNKARKKLLLELNEWRNAITHQDFDPVKLGGKVYLRLAEVKRFLAACDRLARSFDRVLNMHLTFLTGSSPW